MPLIRGTHAAAANPRTMRHVSRRFADSALAVRVSFLLELFEESNPAGKSPARAVRLGTSGSTFATGGKLAQLEVNVTPMAVPLKSKHKAQSPTDWTLTDFSPATTGKSTTMSTSTSVGANLGFFGDSLTGGVSYSYSTGKSWSVPDFYVSGANAPGTYLDIPGVAWRFEKSDDTPDLLAQTGISPHLEAVFGLASDVPRQRHAGFQIHIVVSGESGMQRLLQRFVIDWEAGEAYSWGLDDAGDPPFDDPKPFPDLGNLTRANFNYRPPSPLGVLVHPAPRMAVRIQPDAAAAYAAGYELTALTSRTPIDSVWNSRTRRVEFTTSDPALGPVAIAPPEYTGGHISTGSNYSKDGTMKLTRTEPVRGRPFPEVPDAIIVGHTFGQDGKPKDDTPQSFGAFWADLRYDLRAALTSLDPVAYTPVEPSHSGITAGVFFEQNGKGIAVIRDTLQAMDLQTGIITLGVDHKWPVKLPDGSVKDLVTGVQTVLGTPLPAAIVGIDSNSFGNDSGAMVFLHAGDRIAAVNFTKAANEETPPLYCVSWAKLTTGAALPELKTSSDQGASAIAAAFTAWAGMPYLTTGCAFLTDIQQSLWFHPAYAIDS
ncbi:hypothetical protein AB0D49_29115 [Streptomyces sp. NPDC048290]|uniref:hypothetical protein n=1 Tax=Streptomyces sp. NPDC048290 TaxID=3155811 RepID=UPI0034475BED